MGRSADGTVGNAGNGRYAYTVLVGHIKEGSGHSAKGSGPVAPMGNVGPKREDLGIEDAVGESILLGTVDRNPGQEFLVVRIVKVGAHLSGGVAEALAGLHTRNEEIVVVADGLADLPIGEGLTEMVARRAPLDVAFLEFLSGNRQGRKRKGRQKEVLVFHLEKKIGLISMVRTVGNFATLECTALYHYCAVYHTTNGGLPDVPTLQK